METIGDDSSLKCLRDRVLIVMMALEGFRSVELWRANLGDIQHSWGGIVFLR
ncbi:MAG: hypothetical protein HC784_13795 [Hydrococcus sp. CSU_1_8]|nr:hypothetical protein [Hydrococcus sp. CSU_1_8]